MEIFKAQGSHRECGKQLGARFSAEIQKAISETVASPIANHTWKQMLEKTGEYWKATQASYPDIAEEILGVASGAGVDPEDLFAYMVEEIWATPHQDAKACTDIILTAPLTDGRVLVGHNNDLSPGMAHLTFPVEWNFADGTTLFTVGPLGFYVSVGANNSGIVLTGNEVTPTDNKVGVPRSIIARAILSAKTMDEALKIATDPNRASSYNNIISTKDQVVDVEASGTKFEIMSPENGLLTHSNHYICESLLSFEGRPNYTSSIKRLAQAKNLVNAHRNRNLKREDVMEMLQDHAGSRGDDNTICRHGEKSETVFGMVADLGDGSIWLALGNPCTTPFQKVWQIKRD